jgi:ribosomal RNA-processing protein 1
MSQQPGPDAAKRSKKRKFKQSKPLLEQLPAVPAEPAAGKQGHNQQQQQQPDALSAGNSKFARALGSTDFQTREQGLQALSRFLTHKQLISELDMLKLWKGIYFCFWHSDKEAVQVRVCLHLA